MSSLFNVSGYEASISYSKYDIVKIVVTGRPYYFYSKINNNSNNNPTGNNNSWTMFPLLLSQPSYTTNATITFEHNSLTFGDGYSQRLTNYLDTRKLDFNIIYNNINKKQAKAICHCIAEANGEKVLGFNPSGIFNTGNAFIIESARVNFLSYDNYNVEFTAHKVYENGNLVGIAESDALSQTPTQFSDGFNLEAGVYKIKYYQGTTNYNVEASPNWWMGASHYEVVTFGSNTYNWFIGGGGPGTWDSWSTEELAAKFMKTQRPEYSFIHTGGKISIHTSSVTGDNAKGSPPLQFALYKII